MRAGGVVRHRTLSSLDMEILRFITRFQMVRSHHVAAWTGSGPWYIHERLPLLAAAGLIRRTVVSVDLRRKDNTVTETTCHVWEVTGAGADRAGEWEVPGTDGAVASLPARRSSKLTTHHLLGVTDLACWYRTYGFDVTAEREIRSLEQPSGLTPGRALTSHWSVTIPGKPGIHPPDLGAIDTDGGMWAVELERATKTVQDYQQVISAYRTAGMGQVWHVLTVPTWRRLTEACTRLGIIWGASPDGTTNVSAPDGLIRIQPWLPGRAGLAGPSTWKRQVPSRAPAGFPVSELPDLSADWRKGNVKDLYAAQVGTDTSGRAIK